MTRTVRIRILMGLTLLCLVGDLGLRAYHYGWMSGFNEATRIDKQYSSCNALTVEYR
jgi:hypothetical protein